MQGYSSFRECIEDMKLLICAREIDPPRARGETAAKYLEKKIRDGVRHSAPGFKKEMQRSRYTLFDLQLIGLHDYVGRIRDIHELECFFRMLNRCSRKDMYKKTIKSRAFSSGRLQQLYMFMPRQLNNKDDLVDFIKARGYLSQPDLMMIGNVLARGRWKAWLGEALKERDIAPVRGGWR